MHNYKVKNSHKIIKIHIILLSNKKLSNLFKTLIDSFIAQLFNNNFQYFIIYTFH